MTISKNISSAVALSGIIFAGHAGASLAADAKRAQTFKPLHAFSFDAGQKHGVGYFSNDAGLCKLVLTLAEKTNGDELQAFTATRYEATVRAHQFTRYTSDGHAIDFGCGDRAQAMTFRPLSTVASAESE
jgi:hypothetical protein